MNTKPNPLYGGLIGLMLAAPLVALFYLGDQVFGLPFVPFDLFDWLARTLPGDILTQGIDVMVDAIIALNLGETSSTAKTLEHILAIVSTLGIGAVAGVLFFFVLGRMQNTNYSTYGAFLGLAIGSAMVLISNQVNFIATADPLISSLWILLLYMAWGMALGWAYERLIAPVATPAVEPATVQPGYAQQIDRRSFLVRVGGATATLTVAGAGVGLLLRREPETATISVASQDALEQMQESSAASGLPNADASLMPAPGTRLEYTPVENHYRIDISARPPRLTQEDWNLEITGLVDAALHIPLLDLMNNYEPVEQFITLSCISNRVGGDLISTTKWTGIPVRQLLEDWNVLPTATHMKIYGADGFDEFVDLQMVRDDERIMLTYLWDDQPLPQANGFPLRIYIPDRYGMKQPKWITGIEFVEAWGEGYWVRRGWSETAIVRMTSVVDTVAADSAIERDGDTLVPVGGIAYAGAKGISKVEVQIDDGEWTEAQLRQPLSALTWVIWRYDWSFQAGDHAFRVRAFDSNGDQQIEEREGVRPDGATGLHSQRVNLESTV